MNILTITVCTCWSIVLLIFVYGWGYRNGKKTPYVSKFKNFPPPEPHRKGEGYQPTYDILTPPPTGGSGVPEKTALDMMAEGYADTIIKKSPKRKSLRGLFISIFKYAYARGVNQDAGSGTENPFINKILEGTQTVHKEKFITVYKGATPGPTGHPAYEYVSVPKYMVKECYIPAASYQQKSVDVNAVISEYINQHAGEARKI